jgi:type I restriction enzyme S subunit
MRLGDVCTKIGSGATPRGGESAYLDSGIALVRSQNVYNDGFHEHGLAFLSDEQARDLDNVEVLPADILLNITGDSVDLPPGWRAASLDEIAAPARETVQPGDVSGETPYIALEHMPRRHIALGEWGTTEGVMSGKFRFREGDILFGKLRPYFHKVGVAPVSGVCSTDILVLRPRAPQWFGLALCHLSSDDLIAYTETNSDGTKMPRTSWQALARYPIAIPDHMPPGFSETISAFAAQIRANIIESRTLAALRDALLPKLLSGEIRVPQAEKLAEAKT